MPLQSQDELLKELMLQKFEPIAIVGIGLNLPGKNRSVDEFHEFLRNGGDGIDDIPSSRWDHQAYYDPDGGAGKIICNKGGYLEEIDSFDPRFFNISPKEAAFIDPQQRLFLEVCWHALEDAGLAKTHNLSGGIYVGACSMDYAMESSQVSYERLSPHIATGTSHSAIAGRVSYVLGWHGPSINIDTACSSSLVALDQACEGLRKKDCEIALCGGVNLIHHPGNLIVLSSANMLAPDGRCKTFDDSADGYGRSEGCVAVVLKRLSDALKDADNIYACIRGSAVQHSGESGGLTVPNGLAQEKVMLKSIQNAALNPADFDLVEAHGTGTALGDPIELSAIHQVFKDNPYLAVSSVKSNIGHTEAAAGIIGLVKAALQIKREEIYPHTGMKTPSKQIPWERYSLSIPQERLPWPNKKRRCLINSFGFAGTIASAVLEEAPLQKEPVDKNQHRPSTIMTLSAKSPSALAKQVSGIENWLSQQDDTRIEDIGYACHRRQHFRYRLSCLAESKSELLRFYKNKKEQTSISSQEYSELSKIAFIFTGQGSQYTGMGKNLYEINEHFRQNVNLCSELFEKYVNYSIVDILFDAEKENILNQTQFTQAALFTFEYSLARYFIYLGVKPTCVLGHSIGEIVAACIAGLFSLPDAIKLVSIRGEVMQAVKSSGSMLAIEMSEQEAINSLEDYNKLDLAAVNSIKQCVVSGCTKQIFEFKQQLDLRGITARELNVSHAFHSRQMEETYAEFSRRIDNIRFNTPNIPLISNVTGDFISKEELSTPDYWVRHIGSTVKFSSGLSALVEDGPSIKIEIGPYPALSGLGRAQFPKQEWIPSLTSKEKDGNAIARTLAKVFDMGVDINWKNYYKNCAYQHINLPPYHFDRRPYWLPKSYNAKLSAASGHPFLGEAQENDKGVEFISTISAGEPGYLLDHKVLGKVIFPGAAFVETFIAAQFDLSGKYGVVEDLKIHEPLYLDDNPVHLIVRCEKQGFDVYRAAVYSQYVNAEKRIERLHATATLNANPDQIDIAEDFRELARKIKEIKFSEKDEFYPAMDAFGLHYGEDFQRVVSVHGDNELLVSFALLDGQTHSHHEFINPALLDCAMQTWDVFESINATFLPVSFESITFLKKPRLKNIHSIIKRNELNEQHCLMDLVLFEENQPICVVRNLRSMSAGENLINRRTQFYHQTVWRNSNTVLPSPDERNTSLFIGLRGDLEKDIIPQGEALNISSLFTTSCKEGISALRENKEINHIVYCWAQDDNDEAQLQYHYQQLIAFVQELKIEEFNSRQLHLWLVSENAQLIGSAINQSEVARSNCYAASMWGFGHSLLNENPKWRTTLIDVEDTGLIASWRSVFHEILLAHQQNDFQIAYRNEMRFVKRVASMDRTLKLKQENYCLQIDEYGLFENIKKVALPIPPKPKEHEVQIEIFSAGLNFKDVLNALGLLKQNAIDLGLDYQTLALGMEGAGVVREVGKNTQYKKGDEVIVSYNNCFTRRFNVPESTLVKKPENLSFPQAAAVPAAFITAHYALYQLADLQSGETVLIHAAAGGVGQAAIQLAKRVGAEIFATASPSKWSLLKSQGITNIFNSRDLHFSEEIRKLTAGKGVDVVLNSLNKDYIPASLDCTSSKGRFVELGKVGIWSHEDVQKYRPGVHYFNFDLGELEPEVSNKINHSTLRKIVELLKNNEIQPIYVNDYQVSEVQEAFTLLSRGANVGKLVINFGEDQQQIDDFNIHESKTYLITGGFGGLGQALKDKLIEKGAKNIALWGRNVRHHETGSDSTINYFPAAVDISLNSSVNKAISDLCESAPPLGGVFHAAGVIEDAALENQSWSRFKAVFSAKVSGTDNLLRALDSTGNKKCFFVGFSSVSSVMGSKGQANYAAANAYLDSRLAIENRRTRPCKSINWGPWATIGMAAKLDDTFKQGMESRGIKLIKTKEGMRYLFRRLKFSGSNVILGDIDWNKYANSLPFDNALFGIKSGSDEGENKIHFDLASLKEASNDERSTALSLYLRSHIAKILHFDNIDDVDPKARFSDLGLDSLVAVELKNSLEAGLQVSLPTSLAFDYPSLPELVAFLLEQIWSQETNTAEDKENEISAVQDLSEDEVTSALEALVKD